MFNESEPVSNTADIIDSREIIARIEYLESSDCASDDDLRPAGALTCDDPDCPTCTEDNRDELKLLRELADEARNSAEDWDYGAALIRASYFEKYAEEYASDIHGPEITAAEWPFNCIDWAEAADELKTNYSEVTFDGETYLIR